MIDLTICRPGDVLISSRGAILKYVEKLNHSQYMDHKVKYIKGDSVVKNSYGTRDNMGFVYKKNRKDTDHNIIEIRKALIIERNR
jgi:hypothetical protein